MMDNDSSKTNVLELITEHMKDPTPNHLRRLECEDPSGDLQIEEEKKQESYPSQEGKKPAAKKYPSQRAKNSSSSTSSVIDVDSVRPRSRSHSPVPAAARSSASARSASSSPKGEDPRKQRRRRRYHRERQEQQQKQDPRGAQRANTLPANAATSKAHSTSNLKQAPTTDEDIKRLARRAHSDPYVGCSVDIEMGDDSEVDLLKLAAIRASDHTHHSHSGGNSSSSSGVSEHYDEEFGVGCTSSRTVTTRNHTTTLTASQSGVVPTKEAVTYLMRDVSGMSIDKSVTSIPAYPDANMKGNLRASRATLDNTVGAYSAAPGQGYVRNDNFQTQVLGQATLESADFSLQYSLGGHSIGGPPQEQARRQDNLQDASLKSQDLQPRAVISAVRVDEDDLEQNIREQITATAAQAQVVDLEREQSVRMKQEMEKVQRKYIGLGVCALLLVGIVVTVVAVTMTRKSNNNNQHNSSGHSTEQAASAIKSTLHSVRKKGHLNCGLSKRDEDARFHPEYDKVWKGFNGDWCRAIAAAALDGDVNVTIHDVTESERWQALQNGTLDVLVVGTPASTESLHFNLDGEVPATFSTPFLFDGVGVGGLPMYIEHCATTKGFQNYAACKNVRVCASQGQDALDVFQKILHPSQLVETNNLEESYQRFAQGCCNMIATDWSNERAEVTVRKESGYTGNYSLGEALYSKQPYALATRKIQSEHPIDPTNETAREDDAQVWSEFVSWVLQSLIAAEQNNITQATAEKITQTEVFGGKYRNAFKHAVAAVGNYGEVYERNMGLIVPRDGMNLIADGSTGLHYHRSIGDVTDFGTLDEDGTLAAIKKRGKLICGVPILENKNFTLEAGEVATEPPSRFLLEEAHDIGHDELEGAGIDIAFCRALASSIFQGLSVTNADSESCVATPGNETEPSDERIEFVLLPDPADGYTQLNDGDLDVIAGYRMTLEGDVREPTTGHGYTFSQPYLYGPVSDEESVTSNNRCMLTRQHDQQWSDFVQIVVMSLFYAEEHHIDQPHANAMPYVNLFGPTYKRIMMDSVFAVGNYGEVYERLVEPYLQRTGGPNTLNAEADPQLCSFPGPIV